MCEGHLNFLTDKQIVLGIANALYWLFTMSFAIPQPREFSSSQNVAF